LIGEHFAKGGAKDTRRIDKHLQQSIEAFGATIDCLPSWMVQSDLNEFEVLLDNHQAFRIFQLVQTQWRTSFSGYVGLDYNAAYKVMSSLGVEQPDELDCLKRLQQIEIGFLDVVNKR